MLLLNTYGLLVSAMATVTAAVTVTPKTTFMVTITVAVIVAVQCVVTNTIPVNKTFLLTRAVNIPRLQILRIHAKGMVDDVIMNGTLRHL